MEYLGIDVSKSKFDVALISDSFEDGSIARSTFRNNSEGFSKLMRWLNQRTKGEVHACMEATGTYHEAVARFLVESGVRVSIANPMCIRNFGKSSAIRNHTDSVSALVIAEYCRAKRPKPWIPPSAEMKELKELSRRMETLRRAVEDERNRLRAGVSSSAVAESIQKNIDFLSAQIKELGDRIREHIESNPELREKRDLVVSIPGIGEQTAGVILAEFPDMSNFENAKQAAAYAGLSPREYRSGTSVVGKTRLCKMGSNRLRAALYFPAMTAVRCNPLVRALFTRLVKAGKSKMCALGAAMRKLIHIVFGVLKTGRPFNACPQNAA